MELVIQILAVHTGHNLLHGPVLRGLCHRGIVSLKNTRDFRMII